MRKGKHALPKRPSQHSQSLQKRTKEKKQELKNKKRTIEKEEDMDVVIDEGGEVVVVDKQKDKALRKKQNAHKVAVYKKFNSAITNKHGHRAV